MQQITVTLSDEQIARLHELAHRRALTPEQAVAELLSEQLAPSGLLAGSAPAQFSSALDLSGLVDDPSIEPLTAADIHRLLASEALNPHDDHEH